MGLRGTAHFVALDARAATAAAVDGGIGRRRLLGFARIPLTPGALVPSASGASLLRPEEVREAIRRAVDGAGSGSGRATLVLPDGLARLALLTLPPGADARDFVRFRLAPSLPWPEADAIVDVLPVARGRVIAAALRRAAVAEHEQALVSAGLELERVHLAPLLAVQGLVRSGPRDAVHVVLGDAAVCVVAVRGGSIAALSNRRRDASPGEAARLAAEAGRTARLAANGDASSLPLVFSGAEAVRFRHEIDPVEVEGGPGSVAGRWPEAPESAWLQGVLS